MTAITYAALMVLQGAGDTPGGLADAGRLLLLVGGVTGFVLLLIGLTTVFGWGGQSGDDLSKGASNLGIDCKSPTAALDKLYCFVTKKAQEARDWYANRRRPKKIVGLALRYGMIFLGAIAGVIPVVHAKWPTTTPDPIWASILVAVVALLLALDKFGGHTTGWIRYMNAEMSIDQALTTFRVEWSVAPDDDARRAKAIALLAEVHRIVKEETNQWATEFRAALQELEAEAKRQAEAAKVSAANVTITNPGDVKGKWTLTVDGRSPREVVGATAAVGGLTVGQHTFIAEGDAGGKKARAEKSQQISAGAPTDVSLTLVKES